MRRSTALLLVGAILLPFISILAGCSTTITGMSICSGYLESYAAEDFEACFDYLNSKSARDEDDAKRMDEDVYATAFYDICGVKPEKSDSELAYVIPHDVTQDQLRQVDKLYNSRIADELYVQYTYNNISKDEFVSKHTKIFDALGVNSISYSLEPINDGIYLVGGHYTLTYHTEIFGDITNTYSISFKKSSAGKWELAWTPALIFPDMQWGDSILQVTDTASRGEIAMSEGVVAQNVNLFAINATVAELADINAAAGVVSDLTSASKESILNKLDTGSDVVTLGYLYPDEANSYTVSTLESIAGIEVIESSQTGRYYPFGDMLVHMVGYAGYGSSEELDELNANLEAGETPYKSGDVIGKAGLEKQHEKQLRGIDGVKFVIKKYDGSVSSTVCEVEKRDGYDLHLTIDANLQIRLDEVIENTLYGEETSAAVVVMNPITGEILAAASDPGYDANLFARGISSEAYEAYVNDKRAPFLNKITSSTYPPGSIFKPFIAAEALMDNVLTANSEFTWKIENDYWTPDGFGAWVYPAIKRAKVNNREPVLNMRNALLHSDNIYFAYAALKAGSDKLLSFLNRLGMDEAIPFDLPVSKPNIVNEGTEMYIKLLADMGYGQGELLLSPLQAACMFGAFANGGDIMVPRIIKGIYEVNGISDAPIMQTEPTVFREGVLSKSAIATIEPMLEDVVDPQYNGTGRPLRVSTYKIAGKTGTAEIGSDKSRVLAWFAGYRTGVGVDEARLVLVLLDIKNTEEFNSLKFQIAREMLK